MLTRKPSSQPNLGEHLSPRALRSYYDAGRQSQLVDTTRQKQVSAPRPTGNVELLVKRGGTPGVDPAIPAGSVLWLPGGSQIWPNPDDYDHPLKPKGNWGLGDTVFDGVLASDERLHVHDIVITTRPMGVGTTGRCIYRGVVTADVYIDDNLDWCMRCDAHPDHEMLYVRPEGSAHILWKSPPRTGKIHRCVVALENPQDVKLKGLAAEDIAPWVGDNPGRMSVWWDWQQATGFHLEDVRWDWLHDEDNKKISSGKQMICTYFHHEKIWRPTHAQCEDPADPDLGQMTNDPALPDPSQSTTTTPAAVQGLAISHTSGEVNADPNLAQFTLPDTPPGGRNYRVNVNATLEVSQNNREVSFWAWVSGSQGPLIAKLAFQNASASQTMSGNPIVPIPEGTGQTLALFVSSSPSTTVTYSQLNFNVEAI